MTIPASKSSGLWVIAGLHYLLAVSFFMPGFALVNVGNGTGVQLSLVLAVACGGLRLCYGRIRKDYLVCFILAAWLVILGLSIWSGGWRRSSMNSAMVFSANLFLIGVFALTGKAPAIFDRYLYRGFLTGALATAAYAAYQQLAFRIGFPFAVPPLNNRSYGLVTETADATARSYGLCPEPSVLAALLIPVLLGFLLERIGPDKVRGRNYWLPIGLLLIGLLTSGSLSVLISLPIALGLILVISLRKRLMQWARALAILGAIILLAGVGAMLVDKATGMVSATVARLADKENDPSFILRYSSKVASFEIFLEHPYFGAGVIPDGEYFMSHMSPEALKYELKTGTDSMTLLILSGHGLTGFLCYFSLLVIAIKRCRPSSFLRAAILGCAVVMTIQVGYETLYHVWVLLGLGLAQSGSSGWLGRIATAPHQPPEEGSANDAAEQKTEQKSVESPLESLRPVLRSPS